MSTWICVSLCVFKVLPCKIVHTHTAHTNINEANNCSRSILSRRFIIFSIIWIAYAYVHVSKDYYVRDATHMNTECVFTGKLVPPRLSKNDTYKMKWREQKDSRPVCHHCWGITMMNCQKKNGNRRVASAPIYLCCYLTPKAKKLWMENASRILLTNQINDKLLKSNEIPSRLSVIIIFRQNWRRTYFIRWAQILCTCC